METDIFIVALSHSRHRCVVWVEWRQFSLHTDSAGSPDSAYKVSRQLVRKAPVARRVSLWWAGSMVDNLTLLGRDIHEASIEYITDWWSMNTTVRSPLQDVPHKTFKTLCDRSHFTWSHLKWDSHVNLLSRMRPKNIMLRKNRKELLFKMMEGWGC
jgi:hypothetical protein